MKKVIYKINFTLQNSYNNIINVSSFKICNGFSIFDIYKQSKTNYLKKLKIKQLHENYRNLIKINKNKKKHIYKKVDKVYKLNNIKLKLDMDWTGPYYILDSFYKKNICMMQSKNHIIKIKIKKK